jgi:hypothetical protein
MTTNQMKRVLVLVAATLTAAACNRDNGPAGSPESPGVASPTTVAPATAPVAAPARAFRTPVAAPVLDTSGAPAPPAPQIEAPALPPAPAAMQAMTTTQTTLDGLATSVAGARVRFVDCSASALCTARLEAQSLGGLRALLQSVSQQQGGIDFVAREQLDGFTGRTFVADITLGGAGTRSVPTDENALLGN